MIQNRSAIETELFEHPELTIGLAEPAAPPFELEHLGRN